MTLPSLLSALEAFWLTRAARPPETLEPAVEALSNAFTTTRPDRFTDYLSDPGLAAAYGLFFLPQTLARTLEALEGLALPFTPPEAPFRILDLGCGSGAALLAAAAFFRTRAPEAPLEITAVDHAELALAVVRDTFDALPALNRGTTLRCVAAEAAAFEPEGNYDLIVLSFSLNEIHPAPDTDASAALLRRLHAALRSGTNALPPLLLILEPAGMQTSPRLQRLRDALAAEGLPVWGPCPQSAKPCPLPALCQGYCHDARRFRPTPTMVLLNRRLRRTVSDVKYSFLALGTQPRALPAGSFRLIGPVDKAKGRLVARLCLDDATIRQSELPAKALGSERRHALLNQQRGDTGILAGEPASWKAIEGGRILRVPDLLFTAPEKE